MINMRYQVPATLIGTVAIVMIQPQIVSALPVQQINQIAKEITVLIDGVTPGSGVIIAKEGNTYFVLTAKHVVNVKDEYDIITYDGQKYPLNYSTVIKFKGIDLAIGQFTSNKTYRIATLSKFKHDFLEIRDRTGDYSPNITKVTVFVSGFPAFQKQRLFMPGVLAHYFSSSSDFSEGYDLSYTNITHSGMSGGPILDTNGRLIGIHGKAEGEVQEENGEVTILKLGYSLGIPITTFLSLIAEENMKLKLNIENSPPEIIEVQEIKSLFPNITNKDTDTYSANDWANRGNQLWRIGLQSEALDAYNQAIKMQPDFYQVWYAKGILYYEAEQYENALDSLEKSIKIKPDFPAAWTLKTSVLLSMKHNKEARQAANRAIELNPNNAVNYYNLGQAYADLNQSKKLAAKALAAYEKAIEIEPNYAIAWILRGDMLITLEREEDALQSIEKGIEINPYIAVGWMLRGAVLEKLQRNEDAIASYTRAIQIRPDYAMVYGGRGLLYYETGDKEAALQDLQQAATLYQQSGNQEGSEKIQRMIREMF